MRTQELALSVQENVDLVVEILLLSIRKLRYTFFHIYIRLMAAIFDFPPPYIAQYPHWSNFAGPKNMNVAFGISLIAHKNAGL